MKHSSRLILLSPLFSFSFLLSGCGGGGDSPPSEIAQTCRSDYGNGQLATSDPRLRAASSETEFVGSFRSYLESVNCVRTASTIGLPEPATPPKASPVTAPGGTAGADSNAPPTSGTNTQERGIDEADLVETDGEFLFVASNAYNGGIVPLTLPSGEARISADAPTADRPITQAQSRVRILRLTSVPAAAAEVATITVPDTEFVHGLYLRQTPNSKRQLTLLLQANLDTIIRTYDVSDPAQPSLTWEWKTQGYMLASRRIDNRLYLVNRHDPFIGPPFEPLPLAPDRIVTNSNTIANLSTAIVIPSARFNGELRPTITPKDCYIPVATDPVQRLFAAPSVVYAWHIDLDNPEAIHSFCTTDSTGDIYASTNALYLLRHDLDASVIHKIKFVPDGFQYVGSASVPGTVMRANSFQLSEHNGDLRIITSQFGTSVISEGPIPIGIAIRPSEIQHRLFVLRENPANDGTLQTVATLPNAKHPEPIGKPNEQLFGVRFAGPRAYLVTFQRTDPFYVVDLSNPEDPVIAGELLLPGFSEYLHPFGNKLILGVGHDATDTGLTLGVKVGLFDVSNPAAPRVVGSQVIGKRGSSTTVSYDYHAFTVLENATSGIHRVALPVEVAETPSNWDPNYYNWTYTGLFLFEVAEANTQGNPELTQAGTLIAQQATDPPSSTNIFGTRRSILVGDDVHFVTQDQVWSAPWSDPANRRGPQ